MIAQVHEFMEDALILKKLKTREQVLSCCRVFGVCQLVDGENLFCEGDAGDTFYYILRGRVNIVQNGQIILTRGQGQSFGELSLHGENHARRSAGVVAACSLATLSRSKYLRLFGDLEHVFLCIKPTFRLWGNFFDKVMMKTKKWKLIITHY